MIRNSLSTFAYRFDRSRTFANSRKEAKRIRENLLREKESVVTRRVMALIKNYSNKRFNDDSFWPWLAVYTELRGGFQEGWIPYDFYKNNLLPVWNPINKTSLSFMKTFDYRLFGEHCINPIAVRISGIWFDMNMSRMDENDVCDLMQGVDLEIVIKRDRSRSGEEIQFVRSSEFSFSLFKNGYDYLVQPSVQQHEKLAAIHPASVNSLRITTFLDSRGEITVKHRSLRIGTSGDRIVNTSGYFFFINDLGKVYSDAYGNTGENLGGIHPDTGYRYRDLYLPEIKKAEVLCIQSHKRFPYARFIGWDLYLDRKGEPKLIEWNTRPDIWVNEAIIGPLWPGIVF
jgi:hypothetical protein